MPPGDAYVPARVRTVTTRRLYRCAMILRVENGAACHAMGDTMTSCHSRREHGGLSFCLMHAKERPCSRPRRIFTHYWSKDELLDFTYRILQKRQLNTVMPRQASIIALAASQKAIFSRREDFMRIQLQVLTEFTFCKNLS